MDPEEPVDDALAAAGEPELSEDELDDVAGGLHGDHNYPPITPP